MSSMWKSFERRCRSIWQATSVGLLLSLAVATPSVANDDAGVRETVVKPDQLRINVPSNGCTEKESFIASVDADGKVQLKRIRPDACKGWFPNGQWLNSSWVELGLSASQFQGAYIANN